MKPIKILLTFLGLFTLIFIVEHILPFGQLRSGESIIDQQFSSLFRSLNLSLLFTFIYSIREIKKIEPFEEFKRQRKNLMLVVFLFSWISNVVLMFLEPLVLKHQTIWIRVILYSLLLAVISMLLSILFSGAFMKRKTVNVSRE